jgi:hypothetical protein
LTLIRRTLAQFVCLQKVVAHPKVAESFVEQPMLLEAEQFQAL